MDDDLIPTKESRIWEYVEQILLMTPAQRECYLDSVDELLEAADKANEILTGEYAEKGN